MRSKCNLVFAFAAAAAITLGAASATFAATVSVTDVNGAWATTDPSYPAGFSGLGTETIKWGTPFYASNGPQSGYTFNGAAAGEIKEGVEFDLGTFTHDNYVIALGTSILSADLSVVIDFVIGTEIQKVTTQFGFKHWETDNNQTTTQNFSLASLFSGSSTYSGVCANGEANGGSGVNRAGCADRVTLLNNTSSNQTFKIDGLLYILEITGFTVNGVFFSEFWTTENAQNSAMLRARFKLYCPTGSCGGGGEPPPSPVPLPAAGWMLLAGIAALTAARGRRKS